MSGKVNKSNKKIILTVLLIMIFISIYMYSCEYNDLGLFTTSDGKEETGNGKNVADELDISNNEYFLKLKAKQKNKNHLNDINIRKAIFYAIDRKRIVNELLGGYGEVLDSLFTIDSYYYYPAWSEYDYDLGKAKEFLSKTEYGGDYYGYQLGNMHREFFWVDSFVDMLSLSRCGILLYKLSNLNNTSLFFSKTLTKFYKI